MGKVVNASFPRMAEPSAVEHVIPTIKLRMAKEHILNEANRIHKEHGAFKATLAGKPTQVYGQGHDMSQHGEGKPFDAEKSKNHYEAISRVVNKRKEDRSSKPANDGINVNLEAVEKYRKDNPHLYKDDIND